MNYILTVQDLSKRYGKTKALDGFSMQIPEGVIYGFVGKNGAGKTTLIRTVCGLIHADEGGYSLYGIPHTDKQIDTVRNKMNAMVDAPAVYGSMTADENMRQAYRILGQPSFDGTDELLRLVGLGETGKKKAKRFSQGMRQKLGLAMTLAGKPDFVILDEPLNGLDPQGIIDLRNSIVKLNHEQHITFLISSHNLDELARIATHYGFVDQGKMVKQMTAEELAQACKKTTRLKVSDTGGLQRTLIRMGMKYRISSETDAEILDSISLTQLAFELSQENCELYSCVEQDVNLEAFFIELVGGVHNA